MNRPFDYQPTVRIGPYLQDHHLMGRSVLPAVEALQILARAVEKHGQTEKTTYSRQADFLRFLYLPAGTEKLDLNVSVIPNEDGSIKSSLLTRVVSKTGSLSRLKEHVSVEFMAPPSISVPPLDLICLPEGTALILSPEKLYDEMVPFGPAFQNVIGPVHLSPGGAAAHVRAPEIAGLEGPLGSPFPIDAAFHVACAWGQRYHGVVGFPVAYDERLIFEPTRPGVEYFCRVFPCVPVANKHKYDIWLYSLAGRPVEMVVGLSMRDVSSGRLQPPAWVTCRNDSPLFDLKNKCRDLVLLEIDSAAPFAGQIMSPQEKTRAEKFGIKRMRSFTAARLALKQLSRKLDLVGPEIISASINTLADDGIRPRLAANPDKKDLHCSVAHDKRFAIAIAADGPAGVDVETINDRAWRGRSVFMSPSECDLVEQSPLGTVRAAVRVWTIKEAVAKALNTDLPVAWREAAVIALDEKASRVRVRGLEAEADHGEIENHLITLIAFEEDGPA